MNVLVRLRELWRHSEQRLAVCIGVVTCIALVVLCYAIGAKFLEFSEQTKREDAAVQVTFESLRSNNFVTDPRKAAEHEARPQITPKLKTQLRKDKEKTLRSASK